MELSEWIKLERGNATRLAKALNVSMSYLSQMASEDPAKRASISPARAMRIEIESGGAVSRKETRPDDWLEIWPELAHGAVA